MKKFFKLFCIGIIILILILTVINPEIYVKSAFDGIKLWAITVLPSLLPFFFFTSILTKLGVTKVLSTIFSKPSAKLFRSSGASAYAFLMSILSGYPIGAKIVADMKENGIIDNDEATRLSCLCSTSGPLFIVGSIGIGAFSNKTVGYVLLITHILSALLCGLIFRFYGKESSNKTFNLSLNSSNNLLYDSVYSSVISVACVGGFICVFSVILTAFANLNVFSPILNLFGNATTKNLVQGFLYGIIECTNGCKMLAKCSLSTYSVAFTSALISFGGFSVWVQSLSFLIPSKVNGKIFCLSKTIQAILSFLLTLIFAPLFGI